MAFEHLQNCLFTIKLSWLSVWNVTLRVFLPLGHRSWPGGPAERHRLQLVSHLPEQRECQDGAEAAVHLLLHMRRLHWGGVSGSCRAWISIFCLQAYFIHLKMETMILELCISYLICDNDLLVDKQKSSFLQEFVYCSVIFLWHCLVQLSSELKWTVVTFESPDSWIVICHSYNFSSVHLILYVKPLLHARHVTGAWNTAARQMWPPSVIP